MLEVKCAGCGSAVGTDAPSGMCPVCLLEVGLASDAEFTVPASEISSGGLDDTTVCEEGVCGPENLPSVHPLEQLAASFPQFEIRRLLGRGGMGAVYLARQTRLDRLVALKVLPPRVAQQRQFAERFEREARTMARLQHCHIVSLFDFGETDGLYYLVMEYVEGSNLREALQDGRWEPQRVVELAAKVCDGLQAAHDAGIVHRDIKPENLLISNSGQVKIADFGLSKIRGHEELDLGLTTTRQIMGTVRYMAPEQMVGSREVDHRADIYSLGVLLYELLTGEPPMGNFPPPSDLVDVDPALDTIVLKALQRAPEKRFQQASELKEALLAWQAGTHIPADEPARSNPTVPPSVAATSVPHPAGKQADAIVPRFDSLPPVSRDPEEVSGAAVRLLRIAGIFMILQVPAFLLLLALYETSYMGDKVMVLSGIATIHCGWGLLWGIALLVASGSVQRFEGTTLARVSMVAAMLPLSLAFPVMLIVGPLVLMRLACPTLQHRIDTSRIERQFEDAKLAMNVSTSSTAYQLGQMTGEIGRGLPAGWARILMCILGVATVAVPWAHGSLSQITSQGVAHYTFEVYPVASIPAVMAVACFFLLSLSLIVFSGVRQASVARVGLTFLLAGLALVGTFGFNMIVPYHRLTFAQTIMADYPISSDPIEVHLDPGMVSYLVIGLAFAILLLGAFELRKFLQYYSAA